MSSVPHAYFQNQSLGLRWLDGWMVGCLGLWNWDLKSRTESVQRLFFHFHVQPSLLWNFWTTFCVFEKQVWKSRFKCVSMCFPWNFIWFHHIHWTTAPQSPPRTPSCNTSVSSGTEVGPRSALTWFSTVEHRTISRAFSKCFFFFRKKEVFEKVGKVFLRTWAGTGPSQHHVISRGRELFKHYIDSRCYLLG